jgi:hypothetical protein
MQAVADVLGLLAKSSRPGTPSRCRPGIDRWNNRRRESGQAHWRDRADPHRGHQPAGRLPISLERFAGQIFPSLKNIKNGRQCPPAARSRAARGRTKPLTEMPMDKGIAGSPARKPLPRVGPSTVSFCTKNKPTPSPRESRTTRVLPPLPVTFATPSTRLRNAASPVPTPAVPRYKEGGSRRGRAADR